MRANVPIPDQCSLLHCTRRAVNGGKCQVHAAEEERRRREQEIQDQANAASAAALAAMAAATIIS